MGASAPKRLVIFDYSGTLSIEGPRFGRPENLVSALQESGLAGFGVADVDTFWRKIVKPTWKEGSTTEIGYAHLIAEALENLNPVGKGNNAEIRAAADRFVKMYLDHSRIDPAWRPLLLKLASDKDSVVVIATDHYAEATRTIVESLKDWDIHAQKAESRFEGAGPYPFFVANSADLGCLKDKAGFWKRIKNALPEGPFQEVIVVDDFGYNEAKEDSYGDPVPVRKRRQKTTALLKEIFHTKIHVIPFFVDRKKEGDKDRKIKKITAII